MSTSHLCQKSLKENHIKAEKRFATLRNNPKKWNEEQIKMEKLRQKFLLQKEIKELGFVFITKDNQLYSVNDLDMLNEDTFFCITKDGDEHHFNYTDDFTIEDFGD